MTIIKKYDKMVPAGNDQWTFRVLDERDNRYTTETIYTNTLILSCILFHIS